MSLQQTDSLLTAKLKLLYIITLTVHKGITVSFVEVNCDLGSSAFASEAGHYQKGPPSANSKEDTQMKLATILRTASRLSLSPAVARKSATIASAQAGSTVSRLVKHSGILTDGSGNAVQRTEVAMFLVYGDAQSSEPIWTETQNVYPDRNGHYSVVLGSATGQGLPEQLFIAGQERWLAVQTPGEPESLRTPLAPVPYGPQAAGVERSIAKRNWRNRLLGDPGLQPFLTAAAMRLSLLSLFVLFALGNLFAQPATTVPSLIHYSGMLAGGNGKPATEPAGVTFLIYAEPTGGEALWMETQMVHPDATGHYTVELGAASQGLPADLFTTTESRWLAIQAPGQLESKRERLVSVPYALKAGDAETLGGLPVSAFALAEDKGKGTQAASASTNPMASVPTPGSVTSVSLSAPSSDFTVTSKAITKSGTLGFKWTIPPTNVNTPYAIVKRDSVGGIGVSNIVASGSLFTAAGITSNGAIQQGGDLKGARIRNNGVAVDLESLGAPLYVNWVTGQNTYFNNLVGIGTVFPQAELNLNYGGSAIADTFLIGNNTTRGLQMRDNGTGVDLESIGVPLYVNYVTNQNTVINPNGGSVYIGQSSIYPSEGGAWGYDDAALFVGSRPGPGGFGNHVFGTIVSALFSDDVEILGNLRVEGSKDFSIDHPLDPLNKTLDHAAIESSEVLNQYSGNVTLDDKGEATVTFPDWFAGINTDFRYQLTAIGAPGPNLFIAKEIEGNSFTIAGGKPGSKVSWQVTAKRNDAYMQAHPFQVERMKPEKMRGHYTHPEPYAPKSESAGAPHAGQGN